MFKFLKKLSSEKDKLYVIEPGITVALLLVLALWGISKIGHIPFSTPSPKTQKILAEKFFSEFPVFAPGFTPPPEEKNVFISKDNTCTIGNSWKVKLVSYRILEDGKVQFHLFVQNIENKPGYFWFFQGSENTYVLDNLGDNYYCEDLYLQRLWTLGLRITGRLPADFWATFENLKDESAYFWLFLDAGYCSLSEEKSIPKSLSDWTFVQLRYGPFWTGPMEFRKVKNVKSIIRKG